jgi:hypothetical protein
MLKKVRKLLISESFTDSKHGSIIADISQRKQSSISVKKRQISVMVGADKPFKRF